MFIHFNTVNILGKSKVNLWALNYVLVFCIMCDQIDQDWLTSITVDNTSQLLGDIDQASMNFKKLWSIGNVNSVMILTFEVNNTAFYILFFRNVLILRCQIRTSTQHLPARLPPPSKCQNTSYQSWDISSGIILPWLWETLLSGQRLLRHSG